MTAPLTALGLFALLSLAPFTRHASPEDEAPTLWYVDEDGYRQWKEPGECVACKGSGEAACARCKERPSDDCNECGGKGEADCRACGGEGEAYDPMEEMACPYCDGSAYWTCGNCFGAGSYKPEGSGKDGQKCGPCKGSGSFECEACRGKRHVDVARVGRNPGEAKEHQLESARETLSEALGAVRRFQPTGKESEDRKLFERTIEDARGVLPGLKNTMKLVDAGGKSLRVSAQYVGYERWVKAEFIRFRDGTARYLEHQVALIDTCLERLAFNEQVKGSR